MPSRILFIFGLSMAVVYLFCGVFLILTQRSLAGLPSTYQKILGSGFVIYGLFRMYRYYKNYQESNDVEQDVQ
jgi:hypothetical protein